MKILFASHEPAPWAKTGDSGNGVSPSSGLIAWGRPDTKRP